MAQRTKRRERPLKVNVTYAKPSPEADDCWLRALKILMDATEKPPEAGEKQIETCPNLLRREEP